MSSKVTSEVTIEDHPFEYETRKLLSLYSNDTLRSSTSFEPWRMICRDCSWRRSRGCQKATPENTLVIALAWLVLAPPPDISGGAVFDYECQLQTK
jgi:hypothetical protein